MKHLLWLLIFLCATANATNLRGGVYQRNPYDGGIYPIPGVQVQLCSYQQCAFYVTGTDGIYYFQNIYPGQYTLVVGGYQYQVQVYPQDFQDLPPLTF